MKSKLGSWVANLVLIVAAVGVTLGGFEIALRVFLPQKLYRFPRGLFRSDPDTVFSLSPNFSGVLKNPEYTTQVRINALGLRGPAPGPKGENDLRVLGLGDSFASAFNVSEPHTFLAVAEKRMQQALAGKKVEVINAGTPNYGTWHELRVFRKFAPTLHPDFAVLCVFVGNDLDNNLAPYQAEVKDGFLVERKHITGLIPYSLRSWLQRNSMSYVFLWNAWNHVRPWFGKPEADALKSEKDLFSVKPVPSVERAYQVSAGLMKEFDAFSKQSGVPVLAVLIPTEYQTYPDEFGKVLRQQRLNVGDFDLELPQRRWSDLAKSAGIPVLDLLPILRSHASGKYLYMSLDGHLSIEGNRLAGESIGDAVKSMMQAPSVSLP